MSGYVVDDATVEEVAAERATFEPLAEVLRELADASIRTAVGPEVIKQATERLREALALLRKEQAEGPYGVVYSRQGPVRPWGNAVVGVRNPVAPPLEVTGTPDGTASADFHLGAQYEGPPDLVHGGVSALLLDQLLGEAAGAGGKAGMTGTLTLRYRRGTPLGDLHAEARIVRTEGVKTFCEGHISDAEGVCVEAEGVFILPRWARQPSADEAERPARFD